MTNLTDITTSQLHRIIAIKEKIEKLENQIESIAGVGSNGDFPTPTTTRKPRRRMSAAARAKIAAAARARWARVKGAAGKPKATKKRRKVSPVVRAKLAAIARARWAKAKATGKKAL